MHKSFSRRQVLSSAALSAIAIGMGSSTAFAGCQHDHKKLGYRLGAILVDPNKNTAEKAHIAVDASCPGCGTHIEPDGMSYGEHMQE